MPRMKPSGQDEELEFSSHSSNALIGTPCGSIDSDTMSVASDWSAPKRSRGRADAIISDAPVAPLAVQAEAATTTRTRRTLPSNLRIALSDQAVSFSHSGSVAAASVSTASVVSATSSSLSSVLAGGSSLGMASRAPTASTISGVLSHLRPAIPTTQGIPLLTSNGQSGKRGNDGVLDSVLHRKNFLTQASWPRVMVTLLLDAAATLYDCQASGKAVPDIGSEQVIVMLSGNWDYAASAIYPRLDYEDAVTESSERRITDPMARTQEAKAALRALSGGSVPHGVSYSLEQAQQAVRDEEALLHRMREVGAVARLRPSTLRCSAGKDATGCAVLTACDYRIAGRDTLTMEESTLPPCTGLAPERRSGSHASEATLVYGLGCILHSLVYVSARDRRTHVPPAPAAVLELIAMAKSTNSRRRPSLEAFAAHPFMASVHNFLGLASHTAFVEEVGKAKSGTVRAPWWRLSTVAMPAMRRHMHPVGKVGGRHKHLSVAPPAVIGSVAFSAVPKMTASLRTNTASSSSSSFSSGGSRAKSVSMDHAAHSHGTRAVIGRVSADTNSSHLRRTRTFVDSSPTVTWASPPPSQNSRSAHALASRDMRQADSVLSQSGFATSGGSFYQGHAADLDCDEDEDDESSDLRGVECIDMALTKPATAAEVAGLGLGPTSTTTTVSSSSSSTIPASSPSGAPTFSAGFGTVRDRVFASSHGLSPRAKNDFLSASAALVAADPHALAEMAPPHLAVYGERSFGSDLEDIDDDESADLRMRLVGYGASNNGFDEVLGDGIAVTKSADSGSANSSLAMESIIGATGSNFSDQGFEEVDWTHVTAVAAPAFTVDAAMGRVGKRGRDTFVAPFGSSSANPFPIPDMATSANTISSAAVSSSSSSASASLSDAAIAGSSWPARLTSGASMPQSHLASSSHGLAAVSLVPFARSKPVMPTVEELRMVAAGSAPLMPHGVPNAAASAKSAQPLRVSPGASPESSPGVTTIAPSPTVAEFGSEATTHSSWQPRALRPVVAMDGTLVLSHPAMVRQLTGPAGQ